jgi:hypothetical protein
MAEQVWNPPEIDVTVPATARMYDYWLGGKDNFEADRQAAEKIAQRLPVVFTGVRENRRFHGIAVRRLAEAGVRQFLDIGTGIPTSPNTHEIAQSVHPDAHVVYVDNDPIVLAHARAKMRCPAPGRTGYVDADARDPVKILSSRVVAELIDFEQPVGLLMVALLHFIPTEDDPAAVLATLADALPAGSYVVISHATADHAPAEIAKAVEVYQEAGIPAEVRSGDQLEEMARQAGLRVLEPGVVAVSEFTDPEDDLSFLMRPSRTEACFNGLIAAK